MSRSNPGTGWWVLYLMIGLMAVAGPALADTDEESRAWAEGRETVSIVTNGWVDVREILHSVAMGAELGLQMAPDVEGQVNVHLENVQIDRALDSLLDPADLGYEVFNGTLVVYKRGLVTKYFTFDYPVTHREGRGELQVSANQSGSGGGSGGGSSGGGGGSGGDDNSNKSHLTSTATMSIWPEVMEALKVLVFAGDFEGLTESSSNETSLAANISDGDGRSLVANPMASLIQITAEWDRVNLAEELLTRLEESLQRQVAIEVRIMEISLDDDTQTGVNWQTITGGDANVGLTTIPVGTNIADSFAQFVINSDKITGVLQAVSDHGDLRTVSTPRITTLNNQKAIVRVVREDVYYLAQVEPAVISNGVATEPVVNYTPQIVPVGVVLDVTPQVGQNRVITLNVHPSISDVVETAISPNLDTAPVIALRELDTVGKVRDGQTLIIAGLISERSYNTKTGIPLLKDIPLLGYLFGKTQSVKRNIELIMLLTPTIMDGDEADAMADAEREQMENKM